MSFEHRVSCLKPRGLLWAANCMALAALAAPAAAQGGSQALPLEARTKGLVTAPVTVYEMADFQCPYCGKFARETFGTIESEYIKTGKVRWIFINLPIPSIHANALAAAEFGVCAGALGKFWAAHDMLYATQDQWEQLKNPVPFFQSKMVPLGLKPDDMNACLLSGRGSAMVNDDVAGAQRSGAQSTPSFYIEGGLVEGAQPIDVFRHILDSIYKVKSRK
jgi:protein-disulfide isomerase